MTGPLAAVAGLVVLAGTWLLIARAPDVLAALAGRSQPTESPRLTDPVAAGQAQPVAGDRHQCRHGLGREVCVFCGTRDHPLYRHPPQDPDPETSSEVWVVAVEVPAGWWPHHDNNDNDTDERSS